jgi:hypothetical protein
MTAKPLAQNHKRLPHLHREVTRHGKVKWFARAGGSSRGPRVQLRAEFGSAEFWAEYQTALASTPRAPSLPHEGTLTWLLERYREVTSHQIGSGAPQTVPVY